MIAEELERLASHELIARFSRSLAKHPGREIAAVEPTRLAAIVLALRARDDGEPELLMIKRAEAEGDPWSGHIACPGGRKEPQDRDLAETAVRETREETGIDIDLDGRLLGHLDDVSPTSPYLPPIVIRPYVALVRSGVIVTPSDEVASAFWVPLSSLREASGWRQGDVEARGGSLRVSTFQYGEHVVWGLTERVLRQFLDYLDASQP